MTRDEANKMFSFRLISFKTGIPYMKIRNNFKEGVYRTNTLTEEETKLIKECIDQHYKIAFESE